MSARLYGIPGSHPSQSAELMLARKGIAFKRLDLIPGAHKAILRALRFPGTTVPALKIDGRRLIGTRGISRALDELQPEPPLFPADPERRRAVEDAERWGDEEFQSVPRRLAWWAIKKDSSGAREFIAESQLPLPTGVAVATIGPVASMAKRYNGASDEQVRADLAELPAKLDRIDALIAEGVLGGEELNAADFQIATSVALLDCFEDLRPWLDGRAARDLGRRVVPASAGSFPKLFPADWLAAGSPAVASR